MISAEDVNPGDLVQIRVRLDDESPRFGLVVTREYSETYNYWCVTVLTSAMRLEQYNMGFLSRV